MKQYFKIYKLSNGADRSNVNAEVMRLIDDGWTIKQMEHIPCNVEGNNTKFAASLAILFEKNEEENNGRD